MNQREQELAKMSKRELGSQMYEKVDVFVAKMLFTRNVLKKWHSEPTLQFIQPCELSAHFPVWKCFWQRKGSKSWGTPNLFGDEICMIIVFIVRAPLKCFMQSSGIFWWFVPRVTFVFIFVQVRVSECIHCNYEWGRVQVSNLFVTR